MREILFRAKRVKKYCATQKWTYGVPFIDHEGDCIFKTASTEYVVDPETVGQFTGLTDKNGTKIFEGDIVKEECDLYHGENKKERVTHIGTVIYDKKFCQFGINVAGFSKCHVLNRWKGDYNEVIGNIHDNPELLEGGVT